MQCIFRPRDFLFTVWKVWKLYQIKLEAPKNWRFFWVRYVIDGWNGYKIFCIKVASFLRLPPLIANCCYEISPPKKCNSSTWNSSADLCYQIFSHFDFVCLRILESSQFIVRSKKSKIFVWLSIDILSKHFLVLWSTITIDFLWKNFVKCILGIEKSSFVFIRKPRSGFYKQSFLLKELVF